VGEALAAPYAIAAGVLLIAALAKLRSPQGGAHALIALGLPGSRAAIRALAALELGLAAWCLLAPTPAGAAAMAALYGVFAAVALALFRRRQSCGCFGGVETPASPAQSLLSLSLAVVSLGAASADPRGLQWLLQRGAGSAVVLLLGVLAGVYGAVLVYTQLPQAWEAWSTR
jgi:hypothetical protein